MSQAPSAVATAENTSDRADLFRRENLVAWCIVPFDSKKRSPAERAEMLDRIGIRRLAYDYRPEHIRSFDEELTQLAKHEIELTAWWFPSVLNDEAKSILKLLEQRGLKTQLWVTGGGSPTQSADEQRKRVESEVNRIRPIAQAAARQGSSVGLYNHGGWFGQPENQLAIIERLNMKNVGIVYNLHHGHADIPRLQELMAKMLPHLLAVNLNGMVVDGESKGQKILPLGTGTVDVALLRIIRDSGYRGPIGLLNHTDHDAEARLLDNLEGLEWLVPQIDGKPAGNRPKYRTHTEPAAGNPVPPPAGGAAKQGAAKRRQSPTSEVASKAEQPTVEDSAAGKYMEEAVGKLAAEAMAEGKADRGVALFASARTACLTCHKIGAAGGTVGPDLSSIGTQRTPMHLAESLLWPNRHVEEKYKVFQALTGEGRIVRGYKVSESEQELVLRDPSTLQEIRLDIDDVERVQSAPSVMPDGLASSMTRAQQLDLVAFLADLGHHRQLRQEITQSVLEHAQPHEPATFSYDRGPLQPDANPDWQANVNRDRLYDFYTKEANAFRSQSRFEPLLAEYPGIDGGHQGHWGNQNEASWENDAWHQATLGSLQSGVLNAKDLVIPRAVCLKLGDGQQWSDEGQWSTVFDPDTLSFRGLWSGGFVKISNVRHGFVGGLQPAGELQPLPATAARLNVEGKADYHGFYRIGPRVVFAYRLGEVEYLDSAWVVEGQFAREVSPRSQHSLASQIDGDQPQFPAQWPQQIQTEIQLGEEQPYAIDKIGLPLDNPWKMPLYCGDHDFLPDGSALICTMQGDVWQLHGFTTTSASSTHDLRQWPRTATWRRVASGLHQALGIKVDSDGVFVLGRDQITRLHDRNGDGEADFYECFSKAFETSAAGHDFVCGLQRDAEGNFYTASGNQGLLRISSDGGRGEIVATGFRNPDGLGIYPDGTVTVPCSEGDWTPATMICAVKPPRPEQVVLASRDANLDAIRFYGYRGAQHVKRPIARPELPMVYIPRGLDNSAGGQVFIDSQRWGPMAGNMVHLSFGTGTHFLLLRDEVAGQIQGALVPLEGQFASGAHRGRFSKVDGQLYVSGMAGWGSYTTDLGCLERVRYTGQPVQIPIGFHIHANGVAIHFASDLDRDLCERVEEHFAQAWNYRYGSGYGSSEYSSLHYGIRGHDQLKIESAHVLPDGRTLFLEIPELQRCNQLHLQIATAADSRHDVFATCNALDEPLVRSFLSDNKDKQWIPPSMDRDLALATKVVPNPWRKNIKNSRPLRIEAGKNLAFSTRTLRAKAGEPLALTLVNPDAVPHNWALVKPEKLQDVGRQANLLVADPEAVIRQYVPQTSDVLCYTDIVEPHTDSTIYFYAPKEPGLYPYLCSFPGHWMVMNGELIVE